jgi:hypothetical protein
MLLFQLPDTKKERNYEDTLPFKLGHVCMSINLTKSGFIKNVFVIVSVLVVYIVGALLIIDYFPD